MQSNRGYSLIEVMAAMAVLGVLGAMAVPMVSSATSGVKLRDHANAIADLIGLAKLRATSEFSRSRLYVDLAGESYVIQIWDQDAGAWVDEQAAVELPNGVSFGWGALDEPPGRGDAGKDERFASLSFPRRVAASPRLRVAVSPRRID